MSIDDKLLDTTPVLRLHRFLITSRSTRGNVIFVRFVHGVSNRFVDIVLQVSRRLGHNSHNVVHICLHLLILHFNLIFERLVFVFLYILTKLVIDVDHVLFRRLVGDVLIVLGHDQLELLDLLSQLIATGLQYGDWRHDFIVKLFIVVVEGESFQLLGQLVELPPLRLMLHFFLQFSDVPSVALNRSFAILCQVCQCFEARLIMRSLLLVLRLWKQVHSQGLIQISDLRVDLIEGWEVRIHALRQPRYQPVILLKLHDNLGLPGEELLFLLDLFDLLSGCICFYLGLVALDR